MKVLITGKVSVYEATGAYQIYVSDMIEDGVGNLYVAYEQLKKKLEAEGLFDPDSMYTDYLLTLSSVGLRDLNDRWPVFQYQWARAKANFNSLISPSNMGMNLAALPGINMLSGLMRGTERQ